MRFRFAPFALGLVILGVGWGCYSSIAPTAKVTLEPDSSDLPIEERPKEAGCTKRKPWDEPGVTGFLPAGGSEALILNGENFFVAELELANIEDPTNAQLGRVKNWREGGMLAKRWADAPAIDSVMPWDPPGVTATYVFKNSGEQIIINRFRRWVRAADAWVGKGSVVEDWIVNDAGPALLDGEAPWEGDRGVTAAYFSPTGSSFTVISQNKGWERRTDDSDRANWTWLPGGDGGGAFYLSETSFWTGAPGRPFDGKGVTAAWYIGQKFFVVSANRMWSHNGTRWTSLGDLAQLDGWSNAPLAGCE